LTRIVCPERQDDITEAFEESIRHISSTST
jgi:hypothetical protein